jgi:hypothetical protein
MGSRRQGNSTPQKTNNPTQDSVEKEENEHLSVAPSRMMVSISNELNKVCEEMFKADLKKDIIEILMGVLQQKFKENIQKQVKDY